MGDTYGRTESTAQRTNRPPNEPRFANGRVNSIDTLEYYPVIFCFDSLNQRGITRSPFVSVRSTDAALISVPNNWLCDGAQRRCDDGTISIQRGGYYI